MLIAAPDQAPAGGRIVERIKKLLAHANEGSGATEAEMDTAMALAQEMAFKYNLDIALIQRDDAQRTGERDITHETTDLGNRFRWKMDLLRTLAGFYWCDILEIRESRQHKSKVFRAQVIGTKDNVAVLLALYGWVFAQIRRLATEEGRRCNFEDENGHHIDHLAWSNSFGTGAVARVCARLQIIQDKLRTEHAGSGAIVVSNAKARKEYQERTFNVIRLKSSRSRVNNTAAGRGWERGGDVDLDMRQMGGGRDSAARLNHPQTVREIVG